MANFNPKVTYLLILSFFFFGKSIYAQKNFTPGYIVKLNGDTVIGYIDQKEWFRNPSSILFSQSSGTQGEKLDSSSIKSFCVNNKALYRLYNVAISMNRVQVNELTVKDTSTRNETVFLKVIEDGKFLTFFSYTDNLKSHLYVLPQNEQVPIELRNTEYYYNGSIESDKEFISVLKSLSEKFVPGNTKLLQKIAVLEFYQSQIENIINAINGDDRKRKNEPASSNGKSAIQFWVGAGLNRTTLSIDGNSIYSGLTKKGSVVPLFSMGLDIYFNPDVRKTFLRTELIYTSAKTEAYNYKQYFAFKENYYLKVKQNNFSINESVHLNIYNNKKITYFVGVGAGANFSFYALNQQTFVRESSSDTTTTINPSYINFTRKLWLAGIVKTGICVGNVEVGLAYTTKSDVTNSQPFALTNTSLRLQVNYKFN